MNQHRRVVSAALCAALMTASAANAANSTIPGAISTAATIQCASIEWRITGDDDNDCTVATAYRRLGETVWASAQPLWRVERGLWTHGEDPGNLLAGSLFFLSPETAYEVRLTLSDPDGGASTQVVTVTTRGEPRWAPSPRVRYVVPGTGGGTGSAADPFRGLAAADLAAAPGDVFVLRAGTYTGEFTPTRDGAPGQPIVYVGEQPTTVTLDGGGSIAPGVQCVDLSGRRYIHLEKMRLQNCLNPVRVANSLGLVVRGCTIQPVNQLTEIRGIDGDEANDLFVSDCTFTMPGDWQGIGRTGTYGVGGYGVHVTGRGIVLCYNKVFEAWDALDVGESDGTGPRTSNCDIYNNLVDRASDDAFQTDAIHHNVRVFRNRIVNCSSAVSAQPCFGGPVYYLFNEIYNSRYNPFKYHQELFYFGSASPQETSGMLAFHNTSICSKGGWYNAGYWHSVKNRNNLLLGARPNLYTFYTGSGQRADLDYNGYNRQQSLIVSLNGSAHTSLASFYAVQGQEQHGVEVTINEFVSAVYPANPTWEPTQGYGPPYAVGSQDLQLRPTSIAVDRGQALANINDGYTGVAPDLGCHERGVPLPWYGPRPSATVGVPEPAAGGGPRLRLLSPNPSRTGFDLALESDVPGVASVRVVDAAGRCVRVMADALELPEGLHALTWDGDDDAGLPLAAGVYFMRVEAGPRVLTQKLVKLR